MHTGMLWFDNSKTPLYQKIIKAMEYYEKKHGVKPDLVLVHPSMYDEKTPADFKWQTKIKIRPYRPVLPGHIWVGIEDKQS